MNFIEFLHRNTILVPNPTNFELQPIPGLGTVALLQITDCYRGLVFYSHVISGVPKSQMNFVDETK